MSSKSFVQQPITFRQEEIQHLLSLVKAGESASIVGMSGVGKSNLFNHLLDPVTLTAYLGEDVKNYFFVRVNFHYIPDFTARSVYSIILDELEVVQEQRKDLNIPKEHIQAVTQHHNVLLDAGLDLLKVQRNFKLAIRELLSNSELKIVFLFDQFDEVYTEAEGRTLANLRGLREAYKYRIMYFVFTRETLPNLRAIDAEREEFYELLASNVIGLKSYNLRDSKNLLARLSERYDSQIEQPMIEQLIHLAGGHAGLLRASYLYVVQEGIKLKDKEELLTVLLDYQAITLECDSIWQSLSIEEQRLLAFFVHHLSIEQFDSSVLKQLKLKGTLSNDRIFAPLFESYVKRQGKLWEQSIYFDGRNRRLWISDKAIKLTPIEFRLFQVLYQNRNQTVFKDELADAAWPEAQGSVTDEMIVTAIRRLRRKIEPDSKNPQFITNVRGEGYSLNIRHESPS